MPIATLNAIQADIQTIRGDIQAIRNERPILLFNSQAGAEGLLYDPTAPGQWIHLMEPNPTTRDALMRFNREC